MAFKQDCMMKALGYRSFSNYVSRIKELHILEGHVWTAQHAMEAAQGNRSVTRGQGPPRQSAPLSVPKKYAAYGSIGVSVRAPYYILQPRVTEMW